MKITYLTPAAILFALTMSSCRQNENEAFAYGNFESEDVLVSAETTGTLELFTMNEGDMVKKDQLVGIVDTSQLHLKEMQIRASGQASVPVWHRLIKRSM